MVEIALNNSPSRADELQSKLIRLDEITPILTSNALVRGWMDKNCLSIIYGPSNAGKTFVALDISMHVAAGRPWRGCRVDGGAVLYIAAEGGVGVRNRLAAFKLDNPDIAEAPFTLLPVGVDLHGQGDAMAVCEILPTDNPALIVVDTLARSMGAGDENTAKDASQFIKNCDLIREATGAHVMIIHHTGKDQDRGGRGSSAFKAAVDGEIQVTSKGQIICHKRRDQEKGDPLHFELRVIELGKNEFGEMVTSAVVDECEPPKPERKPLSGINEVAMQALDDALKSHGSVKSGNLYPSNRKVVHIDHWRAACDDHGLTKGGSDSAARTAFMRAKKRLMELDAVREWSDHVWRVFNE